MCVPLYECGWPHECILVCCVTSVDSAEGYVHGCLSIYVCGTMIEWCFQVECFPEAPMYEGLWRCSAAPCPLHKSSVPSALIVSQPLSDWTGSKGSLSLSVSQSPSFTLTLMTISHWPLLLPLGWLIFAFTSIQTVSLHTHRQIHMNYYSDTSTGLTGMDI